MAILRATRKCIQRPTNIRMVKEMSRDGGAQSFGCACRVHSLVAQSIVNDSKKVSNEIRDVLGRFKLLDMANSGLFYPFSGFSSI